MSDARFGRFQKATALVPLALLSAAVTASLAGVGPATTAVATQQASNTLPDGTTVPTEAIEAPASVSSPATAREVEDGLSRAAQTASASGIPASALAAYQRAETVINAADKSCRISWQLIAAIGRVESDHGRYGGNTLNDEGLATPGIYGIALNGKNNTQAISDTDAGQYDADARWDRAVGPMQFIPSTWSVVGVDGDNDGERNPQDIDDAALASAVYLCSGKDDLSSVSGQRASVFRYNHSSEYVDLVLSFMNAYMSGDFTSVPNGVASAGYFSPTPAAQGPRGGGQQGPKGNGPDKNNGGSTGGPSQPTPEEPPAEEPPVDTDGDGNTGGGVPSVPDPPKVPGTPNLPPVPDPLTEAEALEKCLEDGVVDNPVTGANELQQCVNKLLEG